MTTRATAPRDEDTLSDEELAFLWGEATELEERLEQVSACLVGASDRLAIVEAALRGLATLTR